MIKFKEATKEEKSKGILGHLEGPITSRTYTYGVSLWKKILKDVAVKANLDNKSLFGGFNALSENLPVTEAAVSCVELKVLKNYCKAKLDILDTANGRTLLEFCKNDAPLRIIPVGRGEVLANNEVTDFDLERIDIICHRE